jgi:two-component system, LytTR family, sensor kinase
MNSKLLTGAVLPATPRIPAAVLAGRNQLAASFRRSELQFIWGFWAFMAVLTFANALWNDAISTTYPKLPALAPLATATMNCLIWGALTPMMFRLTSRFSLDGPRWIVSLALFLLLGLVLAVCVAQLMAYVRYQQALYYYNAALLTSAPGMPDPASVAKKFWFMKEYVIYLVVLSGGFAHDYFMRYRIRHEQARTLEAEAADYRAELADARLSALRAQLNPHFLFNSLNTVSSLVERDPRGARRMVAELSGFLRDTLDQTAPEVTLERELQTLRRYVSIMQTRFGDRLEAIEQIEPETLGALVPTLLLQPLVENAIKHGIERQTGKGRIEIKAYRTGDMLMLTVLNSGSGRRINVVAGQHDGVGLGLQNTRDRLAHVYGERQSLQLRRNPEGGAVVEVALPFHLMPAAAEEHV